MGCINVVSLRVVAAAWRLVCMPLRMRQHVDGNHQPGRFARVESRVGRIVEARVFVEARKPAYVLQVDFGDEIGLRKSSAQATGLYAPQTLVGKLVVGVVNFPKKQIGLLMSECLATGFTMQTATSHCACPTSRCPWAQGWAEGKHSRKWCNCCTNMVLHCSLHPASHWIEKLQ
jgi:tRNA-binding protein